MPTRRAGDEEATENPTVRPRNAPSSGPAGATDPKSTGGLVDGLPPGPAVPPRRSRLGRSDGSEPLAAPEISTNVAGMAATMAASSPRALPASPSSRRSGPDLPLVPDPGARRPPLACLRRSRRLPRKTGGRGVRGSSAAILPLPRKGRCHARTAQEERLLRRRDRGRRGRGLRVERPQPRPASPRRDGGPASWASGGGSGGAAGNGRRWRDRRHVHQ